jgi:hypothetical protein
VRHAGALVKKNANAALWQRRVIQECRRTQREIPPLLSLFSISNFGLFVRLIELHEYRRSTRTD